MNTNTSRSNASIRKSTRNWRKKEGDRFHEHDKLVQKFERNFDDSQIIDNSLEPISILCCDGGGLRGYGLIKMMEAIEDSNMERGDFLGQFDLISGTSVGGVMTLLLNSKDSPSEAIAEASDCLDECRETAFETISVLNYFKKGAAVKTENSLKKVFEKRYGDTPLYNPNGVPAVVVAASRRDASDRNSLTAGSRSYRPLLLRTYDYPEDEGSDSDVATNPFELAESTSHVKLIEAMAATSAVPGLVERVQVDIDGERRSLADGYLFANDPTVIALNEARKLYPRRPIGLVMSIGFINSNVDFANRAIAIARLSHPDLHYQRIAPNHIFKDFDMAETRIEKIAMLEEEAYNYVLTDVGVQRLLECSLEKLFKNRSPKKWQESDEECDEERLMRKFRGSLTKSYKASITNSKDYITRTQQRMSVLPSHMLKSKRLVDYRNSLTSLRSENIYDLGQIEEIATPRNNDNDDTFNDHHDHVSLQSAGVVSGCCCLPAKIRSRLHSQDLMAKGEEESKVKITYPDNEESMEGKECDFVEIEASKPNNYDAEKNSSREYKYDLNGDGDMNSIVKNDESKTMDKVPKTVTFFSSNLHRVDSEISKNTSTMMSNNDNKVS